jgi:hypothetical protein
MQQGQAQHAAHVLDDLFRMLRQLAKSLATGEVSCHSCETC